MNEVRWTLGVAVLVCCATPALAQSTVQAAFDYNLTAYDNGAAEPSCDCEASMCGCEPSCGCSDYGCGNGCGCGGGYGCNCNGGCSLFGSCCLGDACALKDHLSPCCNWDYGGWFQLGYYTNNYRQSVVPDDLLSFNDLPDQINNPQSWFYVEKSAASEACCTDWGFRADMMYGTDAQKTQAFGNPGAENRGFGTWDASLDHGSYGWAFPQLYFEVARGDWSVIAGHFFTLVGYEVVSAPDNFFFSHAYTMFNSEPFTHTGVLATYSGMENVELYGGWTLGWDTGFDQNMGGSSWLGGFSTNMSDDVTFTYISTAGNLGWKSEGESGYSHSLVFDFTLNDRMNYVLQSDYLETDGPTNINDVGINQYLFYTINDCWALGGRAEWWKSRSPTEGAAQSYYEITGGVNYRPHANVIFRPEIRYEWTPGDVAYANANNGVDYNQTTFGVDCILTY